MLLIDLVFDFFRAIIYGLAYIVEIFKNLWKPIFYIFTFLKDIVWNFTHAISEVEPLNFSSEALTLFNIVPNFQLIVSVLGGIICLLGIVAIIKVLAVD